MSEERARTQTMILLAAVLVVAFALRLAGMRELIMFDDAASWSFARLPWDAFREVMLRFEANAVLYYGLLRAWLVFGDSPYALRSLSLLLGLGTVLLTYFVGKRLWGTRAGLLAAAFLAVHVLHVEFSREARGYALEVLLVVAATIMLLRSRERPSIASWAGYVLFAVLACYAHVLAVLAIATHWIWLLVADGWRSTIRRWPAALAIAMLVAPILLYVLGADRGQVDWIPEFNRYRALREVNTLVGGSQYVLLLSLALGVAGLVFCWRGDSQRRHGAWLALLWFVLPVGAIAAKSALGKSLFIDRFMLVAVPGMLLFLAYSIDELIRRSGRLQVFGAVAATALIALLARESLLLDRRIITADNPYLDGTTHVLAQRQPGDAMFFFTAQSSLSFEYYAHRAGMALPPVVFPDFQGLPTGEQRNPSANEIALAIERPQRMWLVLDNASIKLVRGARDTLPSITDALERAFHRRSERQFGFLTVVLYERRSDGQVP